MPRSGHLLVSNENVQMVSALVEVDWSVTIHQLEQDTRLAHSTVSTSWRTYWKWGRLRTNAKSRHCVGIVESLGVGGALSHPLFSRYQSLRLWYPECEDANAFHRTIEDIKEAAKRSLRTINRFGKANGIQRLTRLLKQVVHKGGDYIEGLWNFEPSRWAIYPVIALVPKLKNQPCTYLENV